MHSIHIDHERTLVDVRVSGFHTPEQARAVTEDVRAAIRTLGNRIGQHVTLYDVTSVGVAPGETIEMLQRSWDEPEAKRLWARKVAYCTPSALGRLQLGRMKEARADIEIFTGRAEAIAWLTAA